MANILIDTDSHEFLEMIHCISEYIMYDIHEWYPKLMSRNEDFVKDMIHTMIQEFHERYERDRENYDELVTRSLSIDVS